MKLLLRPKTLILFCKVQMIWKTLKNDIVENKTFYSGAVRIFVAILLFWARDRHSYGYFILLRWTTCGVGVYFAYLSHKRGKDTWVWIFWVIALIFNPLIPFHLGRDVWVPIDVITGILILASIYFVREHEKANITK